jgi:hypothetical protein
MKGLTRAVHLFIGKGGVMDEKVRSFRCPDQLVRGTGIAGIDDKSARARKSHEFSGVDPPSLDLDYLTSVQLSEEGSFWYPQLPGPLHIEPSRARTFPEGIAESRNTMPHGDRLDSILPEVDSLTGDHLVELDSEGDALTTDTNCLSQCATRSGRTVDMKGFVAPLKPESSYQPDDSEIMVRMKMGDKDMVEGKSCPIPHHLSLSPLPTIEEEELPLPLQGQRGHISPHSWARGRGA